MRLRRKQGPVVDADDRGSVEAAEPAPVRSGPFDFDDVDAGGDGVERLDVGSLLIAPGPGREVRLQVEEATQAVQSVLIAGSDGAIELRAFAAPRHGELWAEIRPQIAAETEQRGGTATEREGRWGTELVCRVTVRRPDGTTATQPSRVIGIDGPRWMLRATVLGRPAVDPEGAAGWEDTLAQVVVRRGSHAMPVGDALPLTLPAQARRQP